MSIELKVKVDDPKVEAILSLLDSLGEGRLQEKIYLLQRAEAWLNATDPLHYMVSDAVIHLDYVDTRATIVEPAGSELQPLPH